MGNGPQDENQYIDDNQVKAWKEKQYVIMPSKLGTEWLVMDQVPGMIMH
jgi:hypothetical protein